MDPSLSADIRSIQAHARAFLRRRPPGWRLVSDLGHDGRRAHVAEEIYGVCPPLGRTIEADPLVAYRDWQRGATVIHAYGDDFAAVYRYIVWHEIGHAVHTRAVARLGWRRKWAYDRRRRVELAHYEKKAPEMNAQDRSRYYHQSIRQERVANRFAAWATGMRPFAVHPQPAHGQP